MQIERMEKARARESGERKEEEEKRKVEVSGRMPTGPSGPAERCRFSERTTVVCVRSPRARCPSTRLKAEGVRIGPLTTDESHQRHTETASGEGPDGGGSEQ